MKLKNPYIKIVALFIIAIIIFSCRKTFLDSSEPEVKTEIKWAKEHFTESVLPKYGNHVELTFYSLNRSNSSSKKENIKTPIWQKAINETSKLYDVVEVPLKYTTKVVPMIYAKDLNNTEPKTIDESIIKASFDRLIIYKDKKGKVDQRIVSFVPTKQYLDRHNGDISGNKITKLDSDFEGMLVYKDWNDKYLFTLKIKDGKAVKKVSMLYNNLQFKPARFQEEETCITVDVYEWFEDCEYEGDNPIPYYCSPPYSEYAYSYEVCTPLEEDPCLDPALMNTAECLGEDNGVTVEIDANHAKLCGPVAAMKVGNSYTGGVNNLGFTMYVNGGTGIPVVIGSSCFSTKNTTAAYASAAFLAAYNLAVYEIMYEVKYGLLPTDSVSLRAALALHITAMLQASGGVGSSFSTGACAGGVPQTTASYCP